MAVTAITDTTVQAGSTVDVAVTADPADATITAVSADEAVATVAVNGSTITITGVAAGTAAITVTAAKDGYTSGTAAFNVTVTSAALGDITITAIDAQTVAAGSTVDVAVTADPADATITAVSADEAVATVAVNGSTITVTGVAAGTATVTATAAKEEYNNATATFDVTVTAAVPVVTTVQVTAVSVEENKTATPVVSVLDQDGNAMTEGYALTYASSSSTVASVATDGTITAGAYVTGANTATLTVTATPTEGTAVEGTATVTVTEDTTRPTIESVTNVNGNQLVVVFSEKVTETNAETFGNYALRNLSTSAQVTLTTNSVFVLASDAKTLTITLHDADCINQTGIGLSGMSSLDDVQYRLFINPAGATASTLVDDLAGNDVATNSYANFAGVIGSDTTGPSLVSAAYSTATGILALTFNENVTATDANVDETKITVSSIALADADCSTANGATNNILNITVSGTTKTSLDALTAPVTVSLTSGAVVDTSSNNCAAATDLSVTFTKAPVVSAAAFDENTRILTLTFNNTMDISTCTGIVGVDVAGSGDPAAFASGEATLLTAADSNVIQIRIDDATKLATFVGNDAAAPTSPTFTIPASWIDDSNGSTYGSVTNQAIDTWTEDTTLPTITSASYDFTTNYLTVNFSEEILVANVLTDVNSNALSSEVDATSTDMAPANDTASITTATWGTSVVIDLDAGDDAGTPCTTIEADGVELMELTGTSLTIMDAAGQEIADFDADDNVAVTLSNNVAPTVSSATGLGGKALKVVFSKYVGASANTAANYSIYATDNTANTKTVVSASLQPDNLTVMLVASDSLAAGTANWTVKVLNVADAAGNVISATTGNTATFNGAAAAAPASSNIVYTDNGDSVQSAGDTLTIYYDRPITVDASIDVDDFYCDTAGSSGVFTEELGSTIASSVAAGALNNTVVVTLKTVSGISFGATAAGNDANAAQIVYDADTAVDIITDATGTVEPADVDGTADLADAYEIDAPSTTAPHITAAVYNDVDANGSINEDDTIVLTFSEQVSVSTEATADDAFEITGNTAWSGSDTVTVEVNTVAASGTTVTLTLGADVNNASFTPGTTKIDLANNASTIISSWSVEADNVDGDDDISTGSSPVIAKSESVKPYLTTATYRDINDNDTIDADDIVVLTFSEPIHNNGLEYAEITVTNGNIGSEAIIVDPADSDTTYTDSQLVIDLGTTSLDLANNTTFQIKSTALDQVKDANANNLDLISAVTIDAIVFTATADSTAPTLVSATYYDETLNGEIDKISLVFSEAISPASVALADFTFAAADALTSANIDAADVTVSGNTVTIVIDADVAADNQTSATDTLAWAADAFTDLAGNGIAVRNAAVMTDGAAPVYASVNTALGVGPVTLTFTEAVTCSAMVLADFTGSTVNAVAITALTADADAAAGTTIVTNGDLAPAGNDSEALVLALSSTGAAKITDVAGNAVNVAGTLSRTDADMID